MRRPRALVLLAGIVLVLMFTETALTSCLPFLPGMDPDAPTAGYKVFTGRVDGFRITFEYPQGWRKTRFDRYDGHGDFRAQNFSPYGGSSLYVSSQTNASSGGKYATAAQLVDTLLRVDSSSKEFRILGQSELRLGQAAAIETTCSYRLQGKDAHSTAVVDKVLIAREIAADYNGRIYGISTSADEKEDPIVKEGYEHIVATFRFLD